MKLVRFLHYWREKRLCINLMKQIKKPTENECFPVGFFICLNILLYPCMKVWIIVKIVVGQSTDITIR